MRGKRIRDAVMVKANGKVATRWRKRRIQVVLGKRRKREMSALLQAWDRLLLERARSEPTD